MSCAHVAAGCVSQGLKAALGLAPLLRCLCFCGARP